ncbi:MAG: preprotein translocase subunit SecA, partial [bacterium]|nr:preprotein translocase subunit SecA [bacterium]
AYQADITYGTNNEFGFDYLRDNMVYNIKEMAQRPKGFYFAIVDEVDSILIDEARTPLIISAPDEDSTRLYQDLNRIIPRLEENIDYNIDEKMHATTLTEEGVVKVEKILGMDIYNEGGIRYVHHLEQALKAHTLFKRDRDYMVKDGEVIIVDEFTGRLMPGRRYSEGLHQAIEAKEGVRVQKESRTLATITFQNYFRMYEKLAGMTGTAATSAEEFHKVYKLEVITAPTNKPMVRADHPDFIFKSEQGKFQALVREIEEMHKKGQPVLCGTISIEKNEILSAYLRRAGILHEILNAKHHEREGAIIAQAGRQGAVTIATNMAGRGVDIVLGGNPPDSEKARQVREVGGLCVIGTERHEARRIDNQLRGRGGRQGDPGETRFFVSLEDDLMRIFGSERIKKMMETFRIPEDQPISHSMVSRAIEAAQAKIEGFNFDIRKHVLEYDDVMNIQRRTIYRKRREIMESENLKEQILNMVGEQIAGMVNFHTAGLLQEWNLEEIAENIKALIPSPADIHIQIKDLADPKKSEIEIRNNIIDYLADLARNAYEEKEKEVGGENMRQIEKILSLRTIDMLWMDHLENMEYLRDSVRLRAYGQQDPLVEYKNEGHRLFKELMTSIEANIVGTIFKVGLVRPQTQMAAETNRGNQNSVSQKTGRNDPCPCGSGKKYKKCHGK